jgi:hypothetical protein
MNQDGAHYPSAAAAARSLGLQASHIVEQLHGWRNTAGAGYVFWYEDQLPPEDAIKAARERRKKR